MRFVRTLEFDELCWKEYRDRHTFPVDRIQDAIAFARGNMLPGCQIWIKVPKLLACGHEGCKDGATRIAPELTYRFCDAHAHGVVATELFFRITVQR